MGGRGGATVYQCDEGGKTSFEEFRGRGAVRRGVGFVSPSFEGFGSSLTFGLGFLEDLASGFVFDFSEERD